MTKIYTPERVFAKGVVAQEIEQLSASEKALVKARRLANIQLKDFSKDGIDVKILNGPRENNGLLEIWVEAFKDGSRLYIDNPFQYKNPPIMVPDGTFHIVKNNQEKDMEMHNFKEDLEEALKLMIIDTIRILNK